MSGVELKSYLNIINGKNIPSQTGQSLSMIDPCSGKTFATIPDSNDADIDAAVRAARSSLEHILGATEQLFLPRRYLIGMHLKLLS